MMDWLGAAILATGCVLLLNAFRLVERAHRVRQAAAESMRVLRNKELSEAEKEKLLQRASLGLFGHFLYITLATACALGFPLLLVWAIDSLGWLELERVLALTASLKFVAAMLVALLVLWGLKRASRE